MVHAPSDIFKIYKFSQSERAQRFCLIQQICSTIFGGQIPQVIKGVRSIKTRLHVPVITALAVVAKQPKQKLNIQQNTSFIPLGK